ncbi:hypothetical protein Nepgr_027023 [Nepenthes gracilis]|uniref:DUF4408 domain-containing protein n=1 Tax=Nepenthes gracilis TaxID=150966 RepID=A0AAD3T949_NEPGR|nr:hypothetical protein Nepgr_027023 [Nepenthes gracilis]
MLRFHRFRRIEKLFRFVELYLVLALLFWLSTRLPFSAKLSGKYFRQLSGLLVSPLFVFIFGNAIVITLIAKSGQFSKTTNDAGRELYEDLRSDNFGAIPDPEVVVYQDKEIVYQDKEIICEENATPAMREDKVSNVTEMELVYRRYQSEDSERENNGEMMPDEMLRGSETYICRKRANYGDESDEDKVYPDGGLSNEEFRRTIEAFIAKQVKFHRDESQAVVLRGQA